jgi:twitching motility two-component system response regulator PilH
MKKTSTTIEKEKPTKKALLSSFDEDELGLGIREDQGGAKRRVLLVEDDPFVSKAYAMFITRSGFLVDVALNAVEARKRLAQNRPDIILLDIIMPGINGFEFLEELKKKSKHKDVPVIMISNLCEESDITRCKRLGAADYVVKSNMFLRDVIDKIDEQIVFSQIVTAK